MHGVASLAASAVSEEGGRTAAGERDQLVRNPSSRLKD